MNDRTLCRAVILDLDGTMVDSAPDLLEAAERMRAELPELFPVEAGQLTLDQIERFVGKGAENLVRQVLAIDHSAEEVERFLPQSLSAYLRHYRVVNGLFGTIYPGAVEGVKAMRRQKLGLACVTNKPVALADALLEHIGLRDAFDCVVGGDSLPRRKPDPLPMLHACAKLRAVPAEVIAIGDSINDTQAARAAGCRVWVVPYGYNHGESVIGLLEAGLADAIVPSLLDASDRILSDRHGGNAPNLHPLAR